MLYISSFWKGTKDVLLAPVRWLDRERAWYESTSLGHTIWMMAPHSGLRVQMRRDAPSWQSAPEFFLCVQAWESPKSHEHVVNIGQVPLREDMEKVIAKAKTRLDKEHRTLVEWGFLCRRKYVEYSTPLPDRNELTVIRCDHPYCRHLTLRSTAVERHLLPNRWYYRDGGSCCYSFPQNVLRAFMDEHFETEVGVQLGQALFFLRRKFEYDMEQFKKQEEK